MAARVMRRARTKKAMLMVRQRAASPGEPGCCAMLRKDRTKVSRAKKPRVAARM